jgi:hypothetical protein
MKQLLQAIKSYNLNYVANNLRFIEFTMEEFNLALSLSPTMDMTDCIVKGAKIKEPIPYQKLTKVCLSGNFAELGNLLNTYKFSKEILEFLLEFSGDAIVKKMLKLSIDLHDKAA